MTWIVRSRPDFAWDGIDLVIMREDFASGRRSIVKPFVLEDLEKFAPINAPTVSSEYEAKALLQALVDHAAELGVFPSKITAPSREIDAIKYHLEDMRKIAFKV